MALCVAGLLTFSKASEGFVLSIFDVGQGDALRVKWGDQCLWIDFGPKSNARQSGNPFLLARHACEHSWLFVTHLDADHIGGLFKIFQVLKSDKLFLPVSLMQHRFQKQIKALSTFKVFLKHRIPRELKHLVEPIWPIERVAKDVQSGNDLSWVLRIWDKDHAVCALVTGDITVLSEDHIVKHVTSAQCSVLKVAHHGSKGSSSKRFLRWANPKVAVISSGWDNIYGHPHQKVIQGLAQEGIWIFRTDWMGRIDVSVSRDNLYVKTKRGRVNIPIHLSH